MENKLNLKNIIGEGLLNRIQNSYLKYMESSAAIYETNGDYAVAIFSSKYCDYLNQASRKIAGKTDDAALKSGKWICHEDCWATSLQSIKEKKPCEVECSGGIKIYAMPIIADGTVIGSNNIGVSNPPTNEKKIGEIAQKYKVDPKELLRIAKEYSPRPENIMNAVKNHVSIAADTIAEFFLRIKTEEALQTELNFSESLIKTAQVIVLLLDSKGMIKDFNPFMEEISGYRLKEVQGKDWFTTFVQEHDRDRIRKLFLKAIDDIQTRGNVNPIITKDGRKLTIEWYDRTVKDINGNTMGLLAIGMDITERIKAEEELQKAKDELAIKVKERTSELESTVELLQQEITERKRVEEKKAVLLKAIEITQEAINIVSPDGEIVYTNDAMNNLFGYKKGELIGKNITIVNAEPKSKIAEDILYFIKKQGWWEGEIKNIRKDRTEFISYAIVSPIKDESGKIINTVSAQYDITERKIAENEILEQRNLFETILNASHDLIVLKDRKSVYKSVNAAFCKFIGKDKSEIIGKTDFDLFPNKDAEIYTADDAKVMETGQTEIQDEEVTGKEDIKWLQVAKTPVRNIKGDIEGILCSVRDITERKKGEEQIKASLKEKEVLLQEIHHRVKNNMTVIFSLLKLQADRVNDEQYREMLSDSMRRIKTMALIHEKLYRSEDLAEINFSDYIKDMVDSMYMSYGIGSHKVTLKKDVGRVALGIDDAIPCGLIVNELVSNSIKHAFPESREGKIKVAIRMNDKDEVELTISDNGIGMPEGLDFRTTDSLGLSLVNALVKQLQGEIELNKEKGTEFRITFKGPN
jgi:PAS domain S-box-containing protein